MALLYILLSNNFTFIMRDVWHDSGNLQNLRKIRYHKNGCGNIFGNNLKYTLLNLLNR